jgi:hypothetical protein
LRVSDDSDDDFQYKPTRKKKLMILSSSSSDDATQSGSSEGEHEEDISELGSIHSPTKKFYHTDSEAEGSEKVNREIHNIELKDSEKKREDSEAYEEDYEDLYAMDYGDGKLDFPNSGLTKKQTSEELPGMMESKLSLVDDEKVVRKSEKKKRAASHTVLNEAAFTDTHQENDVPSRKKTEKYISDAAIEDVNEALRALPSKFQFTLSREDWNKCCSTSAVSVRQTKGEVILRNFTWKDSGHNILYENFFKINRFCTLSFRKTFVFNDVQLVGRSKQQVRIYGVCKNGSCATTYCFSIERIPKEGDVRFSVR